MARRRATIKTLPPAVQEEFKERARASRAKYREQNRHLLMYKAQCHRRTKLSERLEAHRPDGDTNLSLDTTLPGTTDCGRLPTSSVKDLSLPYPTSPIPAPSCACRHPASSQKLTLSQFCDGLAVGADTREKLEQLQFDPALDSVKDLVDLERSDWEKAGFTTLSWGRLKKALQGRGST
ncbi:hypothetical protein B0H13DRAFT_1057938 [Mycena leptocephala]|nr:hypothetical protein B0H13DRAFT_1057938 [Mycena leptocephala]